MKKSQSKFYITTPIFYTNGSPHLGHAFTSVLADVLARYHRIKGDNVRFLTGTDEHGATNVRAAEAAGKSPVEFVTEISAEFRELRNALNLSWDDFIRTSDQERHWPGAEKLWRKLARAGDLYRKKYRGLYCVGHEAFITEKDLVGGKCAHHQKEPEVIEEENWFFRLSKYQSKIESSIKNQELRIVPESRRNEVLAFLGGGLEDVSFSRPRKDLSWGVPVPDDLDSTMYVWCDALANYLSAIGYGQGQNIEMSKFREWWPAQVHVLAKDILRFHALIWPGMLLSADLPLPQTLLVHGFITVESQKMSKTVGNVVNPLTLVRKYGIDPVRYYLLREIASTEDGDFSVSKFEQRYNGDLANGLGNLVARVAALGEKLSPIRFDFKNHIEKEIDAASDRAFTGYEHHIAEFRFNEALADIWALVGAADRYINKKKPWAIADENELRRVLTNAGYLIGTITNLLEPFLPESAGKIKKQICFQDSVLEIKKGEPLFPRR